MTLSELKDAERQALLNLSRKKGGEDVAFINIADARALTELGLAIRTQQGWEITPAGAALLGAEKPTSAPPHVLGSVARLTPRSD